MGFPRQECWSGLPFPSPGDLSNQGSNPSLLHCRRIFLQFKPPGKPNLKGTKAQWNGATDVLDLCLPFNYDITLFIHFIFWVFLCLHSIFPGRSDSKASAYNVGYPGLIPGSGRSPGEGNGNPLHYSCLENPMDWGSWKAAVPGVAKSQTRLSDFTFTFYFLSDSFAHRQDHSFHLHGYWSL